MLTLQHSKDYAAIKPLYADLVQHLSPAAVLDGGMPGWVYADNAVSPAVALICCAEGTYLASRVPPQQAAADVARLIAEELRPKLDELHLFVTPAEWGAQIPTICAGSAQKVFMRRSYALETLAGDWHLHVPEGFELRHLDAEIFARSELANHQHVLDWATYNWGSVERFLAHGFGFALLHEQTIASWTLADCISGDRCEIGIHTDPAYRRRGLATIVVAANVAHALSRGLRQVGWQCSEDNVGSQGVAEKVGFKLTHTFPCYGCRFEV